MAEHRTNLYIVTFCFDAYQLTHKLTQMAVGVLQEQRREDEIFRREWMAMERERQRSDKEAFAALISTVAAGLTTQSAMRNTSIDSRPESATGELNLSSPQSGCILSAWLSYP